MYIEMMVKAASQQKRSVDWGAVAGGAGAGLLGTGVVYGLGGLIPELKANRRKRLLTALLGGAVTAVPGAMYFAAPRKQDPGENDMPAEHYDDRLTEAQLALQHNDVPKGHYGNRMTRDDQDKQDRRNSLKDDSMPKNHYQGRMTETWQEQGGTRNSIPKNHYQDRKPESKD